MIESKANKDLEEQIDLYVNGKLNKDQIDELWGNLIQDDYYLDYLKSVVNLKSVLENKHKTHSTSKILSFKKVAQYAAAAAVILIASVVTIFNINSTESLGVSPIDTIGLDVVRDVSGISEAVSNEVIRRALKLASEGESEEAIQLLQKELETATDPQLIADISLSLGSIRYNSGEYLTSVRDFRNVTAQTDIEVLTLEKGYWFLGNAYFQLDRLEEAETAFQKAYDLNGAYSRIAKTYVDALREIL